MSICKTYACVANKSGKCIPGLQSLNECEAYHLRTPEHEAVVKTLKLLVNNYKEDKIYKNQLPERSQRDFFSGSKNANHIAIKNLARNWINK